MKHGFFAFVTVTAAGVLITGAAVGLASNPATEKHQDTKKQLATSLPTSAPAGTFTVNPKNIAGLIKGVRKISRYTPKGDRAVVAGLLRVLNRHLPRDAAITVPADDGEALILEKDFMEACFDLAKESRTIFYRTRTTDDPVALMAEELLAVVAQKSPSGTGRTEAAGTLHQFSIGNGRVFSVDTVVLVESLGQTINFLLNNAAKGGEDIRSGLAMTHMQGFLCVWLSRRAMEPSLALTRDADAREIKSIKKKLSDAIAAAKDPKTRIVLTKWPAALKLYTDIADRCAAMGDLKKELLPWIKSFLAAVNKGDKAEISKYLTAKTAANLGKNKSLAQLRAALSGVPGARELHLHKLSSCAGLGDKISFRWVLKVIDDSGATTVKVYKHDMRGFKVAGGFQIGEK